MSAIKRVEFFLAKKLSIRIWFALLFEKQSFALLNHAIQTFTISFIDFSTLAWNPFRIFIHNFLMPSLTYQGSCDTCWKIDVLSFNMQKNEKNSYFPMKKSWPLLLVDHHLVVSRSFTRTHWRNPNFSLQFFCIDFLFRDLKNSWKNRDA